SDPQIPSRGRRTRRAPARAARPRGDGPPSPDSRAVGVDAYLGNRRLPDRPPREVAATTATGRRRRQRVREALPSYHSCIAEWATLPFPLSGSLDTKRHTCGTLDA